MIVREVTLHRTVYLPEQFGTDQVPKIAFCGRSNVGKSSLINRLLQRKNMARTSSRPGKTVSVNFFRINEHFDVVDLPGYGYARLSQEEKRRVQRLIHTFFHGADHIRLACLLLDCRREMSGNDMDLLNLLLEKKIPILTILTKGDKLSFSKLKNQIIKFQKTYGLVVIPFSIQSSMGQREIWEQIDQALKE